MSSITLRRSAEVRHPQPTIAAGQMGADAVEKEWMHPIKLAPLIR